MRVVLILLVLLLLFSPVEASPKIISYGDTDVKKVVGEIEDSFGEILKIDSEIESLIKENAYSEREIYELTNKLKKEKSLLEQLEEKANAQLEMIESDSLVMQIFRATGDSEKYIEENEVEVESTKQNISELKEYIKTEKELVSLNKKEISSLLSEREEYFVESTDSFEEEDIGSTIEDLESTTKVVSASSHLLWPLKEYGIEWVSSYFGVRDIHPITKEKNVMHHGIDIAIPFNRWPGTEAFNGAPVYVLAAADGVAYSYETSGSYGNYVIIVHDQFTTRYAHTHENLVKDGETVKAGQPIAIVGSTGLSTNPHLHFEVWVSGVAVNPLKYLKEVSYGQ